MENDRKKIDDLFKSKLGNYTETPPPAVWDALEKRLDEGHTPTAIPGRAPWFKYIAISAVVAILVVASFTIARRSSIDNNIVQQSTNTDNNAPVSHNVSNDKNKNNNTNNQENNNTPTTTDNNTTTNTDNKSTTATTNNKEDANKNVPLEAGKKDHTAATGINAPKQVDVNTITRTQSERTVKNNNKKRTTSSSAKNAAKGSKNNKSTTTRDIEQPQNEYNGSVADVKTTVEQKVTEEEEPKKEEDKTDKNKPDLPPPPPSDSKDKRYKPKINRFEAGIKGGYEFGFDNDAAKKAVFSPYLQYNLTRKFSIMLQPAIKSASVNRRQIGDPKSYYKVNADGMLLQHTDSIPVHIIGTNDSFWIWNYTYLETHDSIVKTNVTGGTYVEFELPVLLKYYITKEFSVYGGVNMAYGKQIGITEQTYIERSLQRSARETGIGQVNAPAPAPPQSLNSEIVYTGSPYSSYTGPQYPAPKESLLRFGYMLGFSYEYNKRWLFDALLQQGTVKSKVQGGFNTSTPLSAPYIRLTIGYKLIK